MYRIVARRKPVSQLRSFSFLDKKTDLISVPHALVYFGVVIFFVYFKLSSLLLGIHDPFLPFENLFCAIFMGGIWDTLQRILAGKLIERGHEWRLMTKLTN